jgi:hypothetical protein
MDTPPDRLAWPRILRDVRKVLAAFNDIVKAKHYTKSERHVTQTIEFDSVKPTPYSAFVLGLEPARFVCCRTLRTEYDVPVTAVLLVIKRHAPMWLKITSDGRWVDWEPARTFLRAALDYGDEDFGEAKKDFDELIKGSDEEFDLDEFLAAMQAEEVADARP